MPESSRELPEYIAAVDLGSNSFHMVLARRHHGQVQIVDKINEMVRLAQGLDRLGQLDDHVAAIALECLGKFSQRLRGLSPHGIRAVGTSTLRRINDEGAFLALAEQALGHPIEIVSGIEEARLIHLGVSHSLAHAENEGRRLIIDIGGGSTELIIGGGTTTQLLESIDVGCVDVSRRYFADGVLNEGSLRRAAIAVQQALLPIRESLLDIGWTEVVGSSGSILSMLEVGQHYADVKTINRRSMDLIREKIIAAGSVDKLNLKGLAEKRQPVFAGGFSVLDTIMRELDIEDVRGSDGALREGLLYDLIGRYADRDVREFTVRSLSQRYQLNEKQALRVATTAARIFDQVAEAWHLDVDNNRKLMLWASRLHEIGLAISHTRHHHHGAYLLANSDLAGFSQQDQQLLAALVRCHRKRLLTAKLQTMPKRESHSALKLALKLALILRLAVLLHRGYRSIILPDFTLKVSEDSIQIDFLKGWLDDNPLTGADLALEAEYQAAAGFTLTFS